MPNDHGYLDRFPVDTASDLYRHDRGLLIHVRDSRQDSADAVDEHLWEMTMSALRDIGNTVWSSDRMAKLTRILCEDGPVVIDEHVEALEEGCTVVFEFSDEEDRASSLSSSDGEEEEWDSSSEEEEEGRSSPYSPTEEDKAMIEASRHGYLEVVKYLASLHRQGGGDDEEDCI